MPSDFVDRRVESAYRNGPVRTYQLKEVERVILSMGMDNLPSWDELRQMAMEDQREIMLALVKEGLKNAEIAQRFGGMVNGKDISNRLQSLKIRKVDIPGSSVFQNTKLLKRGSKSKGQQQRNESSRLTTSEQPKEEVTNIMPNGLSLSLAGKYNGSALASKLQALASFLHEGIGSQHLFEITFQVQETEEMAPKMVAVAGPKPPATVSTVTTNEVTKDNESSNGATTSDYAASRSGLWTQSSREGE